MPTEWVLGPAPDMRWENWRDTSASWLLETRLRWAWVAKTKVNLLKGPDATLNHMPAAAAAAVDEETDDG